MKRWLSMIVCALALGGCSDMIRDRIYRPPPPGAAPDWTPPAPERVTVTTEDGLALDGLWWAPRAPSGDVIVYFHGNGGSLHRDGPRAETLAAAGTGVLMASYRGYSGNPGRPTEAGLAADARAFVAAARERLPEGGRLYLVGHSLGGAVALGEAASRPVDGVATIGTFARIADLAPGIARPFMPDRYDSLGAIARVAAPVTLFHGTRDGIVPYAHAERLRSASDGRARIVTLEGAGHHPDPALLSPMILSALRPSRE